MKGRKRKESKGIFVEGRIQHKGKFAFLLSEEPGKPDVYLQGESLRLAMDGDTVRVRLLPPGRGRSEGEIVQVTRRAKSTAVGVLQRDGRRWTAVPGEGVPIRVLDFAKGVRPEPGALAVVRVTQWPTAAAGPAGVLAEVLGRPGRPRVRATAVLRSRELAEAFPERVLAESRAFPERVPRGAWKGRQELFGLPLFTIDGADAKDFDDAVSLEDLGGGRRRLGVHIADVSHYVRPGSAIDDEAYARATSVYLPDRVVPMLPPNLSDHLCSLMPHVERLSLSCFIDLDAEGRVQGARFAETVIRSRHRFTYEEVETILLGARPQRLPDGVLDAVIRMGVLAKKLTAARVRRGALDFDLPEFKVETDSRGIPVGVSRRERLDSHRLIEEFMILANEAAARELIRRSTPALHRIHPAPDARKLEALGRELAKLSFRAPGNLQSADGKGLQALLTRAVGHPLRDMITVLTVRSLKQAAYAAVPSPHFGLASRAYTHFTSPIRRYPDLLVHRAIRGLLKGNTRGARLKVDLARAATHCSERERLAVDAERRAVDILRSEIIKQEEGRVFTGVVSRSMPYGCFVELDENGAHGLLKGGRFPLGTKISVKVSKVDLEKGEIDLVQSGKGR